MERIDPLRLNRDEFEKEENRNVFIIMRYAHRTVLDQIESTIKETLLRYGLKAILAKDVVFDPELWNNIKFCMEHSRYGIVVFDRVKQPDFSPNVTLELGYMLALRRPSLILKEHSIATLNTDIIGHLYTAFDPYDVRDSVSVAIENWLTKLGHSKFRSANIITADNPLEANKARTKSIIHYLEEVTDDGNKHIIRQAASMSSIAISDKEAHRDENDGEYHQLLLRERDLMSRHIEADSTLRLIISPEAQIERVELGLVSLDYISTNIIPRYDRLIKFITRNLNNSNLQVTFTLRLPHDNLTIIDEQITFIGRKRRRESGFPYTTQIFDPAVVEEEIEEFDNIFTDNVGVLLNTDNAEENLFGSQDLKMKVIEKLNSCKAKLKTFCDKRDAHKT